MTSRGEAIAGILSVATPLLAFWTIEVALFSGPFEFGCSVFGPVTNGIMSFEGCLVYHLWMYAVIVSSWGMAYLLLRDE
jgi:hypothetical protein